ncbi:hypothetical protein J1605_002489 [Eschrichtius robustus]|uniref:Uncharacterized protein n=1 Tax=Eschrichtius robustus TaxID=9764 RepID=A0AB34HXD3_ESCRO|nr:hypothetical protein J1605_002489 [Eschrichtius robustus]
MVDMAHQPSFRLPQSPGGGQRAHSEPEEKPLPQPAGEQKPEDPQVSREQGPEPPDSGPTLIMHPPRDLEIQECQFLDKEDWGPQRTSKEMSCLQNVCMRLRESLSTIQADNLALGEKLQDLPNSLYESLKEEAKAILKGEKAILEEGKAVQEGAQAAQEGALFQQAGSQKAELVILQPDPARDNGNQWSALTRPKA